MTTHLIPPEDFEHRPRRFKHALPIPQGLAEWQLEQLQIRTAAAPILVTDDDLTSRNLLRTILQHKQIHVVDTHDALSTLQMCRSQPIALVMSDVMKHGMDGLEMLEHMKNTPQIRHIPVVFVSGASGARGLALEMGAAAFLNKPFHPNDMLQTIWRILNT